MIINKKAAMFGLDARIALAIFGALSVISGAALFSAIEKVSTVAFTNEMVELGKAVEAYMLDVGENVPLSGSNDYQIEYGELVDSSASSWQGPYFYQAVDGSNTYRYDHPDYGVTYLWYSQADITTWGEDSGWSSTNLDAIACGDGTYDGLCGIWGVTTAMDKSMALAIDENVDNSDGGKEGTFRYFYPSGSASDSTYNVLFYLTRRM